MERFILQKSDKDKSWVCTDTHNLIVCVFEDKNFNEIQKFTTLEDFDPLKFMELARLCREMGDWLREHHYDKIF